MNSSEIRAFDQAMLNIYKRAREEAGYKATAFLSMLHKQGGLGTAKQLINAAQVSQGYTALFERNRLDLTVEAMVLDNPRWHTLFTPDELEKAKKRLKKYNYALSTA